MILLNKKTKTRIKEQSIQEAPSECCGLIVKNERNKPVVFPCENISKEKEDNYRISPEDYLAASELGDIEAVYHSHSKEYHWDNFTPLDLLNEEHGLEIVLYLLHKDKFLISSQNNYLNQYLERDYVPKVTDCFTLLTDFYRDQLDIHVTKYDYSIFDFFNEENWENKKESPFDVFFEKEGFEEVQYEDIKMYDVLFFKNVNKFAPTFSCHMGLYVGNDTMLHQPFNKVSELSPFTKRHMRYINKIIRHKSLM